MKKEYFMFCHSALNLKSNDFVRHTPGMQKPPTRRREEKKLHAKAQKKE